MTTIELTSIRSERRKFLGIQGKVNNLIRRSDEGNQ
jgi:hypothetical protein